MVRQEESDNASDARALKWKWSTRLIWFKKNNAIFVVSVFLQQRGLLFHVFVCSQGNDRRSSLKGKRFKIVLNEEFLLQVLRF